MLEESPPTDEASASGFPPFIPPESVANPDSPWGPDDQWWSTSIDSKTITKLEKAKAAAEKKTYTLFHDMSVGSMRTINKLRFISDNTLVPWLLTQSVEKNSIPNQV